MFEAIDHVAYLVEDIGVGRQEVEAVYGIECAGTNSAEHRQTAGADAAFFVVGEVVVELLSPIETADPDESWAAAHMAEHGAGFFHIAYAVTDLAEAVGRLEEHGIGLLHEEPVDGFSGPLVTLDSAETIVPTQLVEPDGSGPRPSDT